MTGREEAGREGRMEPPLVMLAAGGTGGHLFVAEALARELLTRAVPVALVTDRRGKAFGEALSAVSVYRIHAATLGSGIWDKIQALGLLAAGTLAAWRLITRLRPALVVGFGGYPSLPTVVAARLAGVPVLLHEQNAVLGRANRLVAAGARRLALSFPTVRGVPAHCRDRIVHTGNPVRPAVAAMRQCRYEPPGAEGPVRLLVMGGSQGARVFGEVVPAALALLPAALRARLVVSQQCRPEDLDAVRGDYQVMAQRPEGAVGGGVSGGGVELSCFFRDVPARLAGAHLVICRAGASTIAELTAVGRPALLVPYPFATDDHQTANAQALAQAGGAWHIAQPEFSAGTLADHLEALLTKPDILSQAAAVARGWAVGDAAARLADTVVDLIPVGAGSVNGPRPQTWETAE